MRTHLDICSQDLLLLSEIFKSIMTDFAMGYLFLLYEKFLLIPKVFMIFLVV